MPCRTNGTRCATEEERLQAFWDYIDKKGEDDCWIWKGGSRGRGYGAFYNGEKTYDAHRYMMMLITGQTFPSKVFVLHRCNSRACVNPKHLYLGNCANNNGDTHANYYDEEIWLIRHLYNNEIPQVLIAKMFKCPTSTLCMIVHPEKYGEISSKGSCHTPRLIGGANINWYGTRYNS